MKRSRKVAWTVAAVSFVAMLASIVDLAIHVHHYHQQFPPSRHYFESLNTREFTFAGHPATITDELDQDGRGEVIVQYGEDQLRLRVTIPNPYPQPELQTHENWLRLLLFARAEGIGFDRLREKLRDGEIQERLVLVKRIPPQGWDERTFGQVRRRDWRFGFYEFLPEGGFRKQELKYPESERAYQRRVDRARREGREPPPRDPDELKEGTWQFDAALMVMPAGSAPGRTFTRDALVSAGWSWPVAGFSFITFMIALGFAVAPNTQFRPEERAHRRRAAAAPENAADHPAPEHPPSGTEDQAGAPDQSPGQNSGQNPGRQPDRPSDQA